MPQKVIYCCCNKTFQTKWCLVSDIFPDVGKLLCGIVCRVIMSELYSYVKFLIMLKFL